MKFKTFLEMVNKSDIPAYLRKNDKMTTKDLEKERTKNRSHPETIKKIVESIGFKIEKSISISMFRSATLKKIIPANILSRLDSLVRPVVSKFNLGPSVIYKLRK